MYKQKYYKYKNKYLDIIKEDGFSEPDDADKIDAYDSPDLKEAEEEVYDVAEEDEDEIKERLEDMLLKKENFEGYDTKGIDFATEDLQQIIVDIGEFGEARGKIYDYDEFDSTTFTDIKRSNKNKILSINDTNSFDTFTERYGKMKNDKLFIRWSIVAKDYMGIYIASSVQGDRDKVIPLHNKTTTDNWLDYDYNHVDDVVIFQRSRDITNFKKITKPFKGKVLDEYAISEEEFAKFSDPITFNKILLITDVKTFDKFTNKYGVLAKNKYINIDWDNVNHDYGGFYIDKDNDFFNKRDKTAYYKETKFESWIERNDIHDGVVYLFD